MVRDRRLVRLGVVLAGVLAATAPAVAQPAEGSVERKEGEYGGVNPAAPPAGVPVTSKRRRPPPRKSLLWVGFTQQDGGASELFFQAVEPFTVSQRLEGKTLVVLLEGLKSQARNTRRPLDTRFFDSAIARVTTRKVAARRARRGAPARPAGIEVRVVFKDPRDAREATLRSDTAADKLFYAYLGFAPPSAPGPQPAAGPTMQDPE